MSTQCNESCTAISCCSVVALTSATQLIFNSSLSDILSIAGKIERRNERDGQINRFSDTSGLGIIYAEIDTYHAPNASSAQLKINARSQRHVFLFDIN